MDFNKTVSDYIHTAHPEHADILKTLRELIHTSVDGVSEAIKWGFPVFAKSKDFAYFRYSKKHVTLGFYNIDRIDDPDNVLQGSGNTLKHIKIKALNDYDEELVKKWLRAVSD